MTVHWGVLDLWPDPLCLVFFWREYLMGIKTDDKSDRKDCQVWMQIEIKNAFFSSLRSLLRFPCAAGNRGLSLKVYL